jgi:predicted transcriptional regulator of viral defense system
VATVIGDLLQEGAIDTDALAEAAADYPSAVAQRTGYLVNHMADEVASSIQLDPLEELVADATYTVLDPQRPREGEHDRRWSVIVNTDVEHDL